jgi:GNAT superfamily N-acetyltransferase
MHFEAIRDEFTVSTDPARLDLGAIHAYLSGESYWSKGIPLTTVKKALGNSLCFGLYQGDSQIGLARVISDRATYCYLCDVYVLDSQRGKGLGKWLIECVINHPELQGLRRMSLATADAHSLYAQFGFTALSKPDRMMEKLDNDIYKKGATPA